MVLKGTLVFRFGPRLGLKTGVLALAEQKFKDLSLNKDHQDFEGHIKNKTITYRSKEKVRD